MRRASFTTALRLRAPLAGALAFAFAACGPPTPAPVLVTAPQPPAPPIATAVTDAGSAPPRARVRHALLDAKSGGSWLATLPLPTSPSPAELVEPCYARALERDPALAGAMTIAVEAAGETAPKLTLVDASPGVAPALWSCVMGALSRLNAPLSAGAVRFDLYLSFDAE